MSLCIARRLCTAATWLLLAAGPLSGQDRAVTQYIIRAWDRGDGLPQNSVTSIVQTAEGYVWLATEEGMARFDGTRFTTFDRSNTPAFTTSNIDVIKAGHAGGLWIGTAGGGVVHYEKGAFTTYSSDAGLAGGTILSLSEEKGRGLWIGTAEGLSRLDKARITAYGPEQGLPRAPVNALVPARAGGVWVGLETGALLRFDGTAHPVPAAASLLSQSIQALLEDADGTLWIGTSEGLFRLRGGAMEPVTILARPAKVYVKALQRVRDGSLWVGTRGEGLVRLHDGRAEQLTAEDGLPNDDVMSLMEDREGSLWVGTIGRGVAMLRAGAFVPFTTQEGLSGDVVLPILEDRSGAIWMGTYGQGLNRLENGQVQVFTEGDGLASDFVLSLAEAPDGALWIGTRNGLSRRAAGRFTTLGTADGLPSAAVLTLYTDRSGTVWVGTTAGLGRIDGLRIRALDTTPGGLPNPYVQAMLKDRRGDLWVGTLGGLGRLRNGRFEMFTTRHGLASDLVLSLYEDAGGALWIGTSAGLTRFRDSRFRTLDIRNGLLQDQIFSILEDERGFLWLSGNHGVSRSSLSELNAAMDGAAGPVASLVFGAENGMPSSETNGGIQPAGWKDRRGRLWFPTIEGAAMIDPATVDDQRVSAPALIERVLADGRVLAPATGEALARLPAGVDRLEVEYTAINFAAPARVTFQYRLEGFDTAWVSAGTRRTATYTNLSPGRYRFLVRVRDPNQRWSEATHVDLAIAPHVYQTWPFRLLLALSLIGAVVAADRARTRRHASRERALLGLIDERERAERRYRDLFENASDVVLTTDIQGHIVSLNRKGEELLRRAKSEVIGEQIERFMPPGSWTIVRRWTAADAPAPEGSSGGSIHQLEMLASDGRRIPVEASVQWVYEEDRPVGVQAIMRDMTERHHLEEQLRQAQKMEAVGRLAGGIAHDFNNLLSVIGSNAELALMDLPEGAEVREDIEEIRRASERAASLTRQLLTFSRQQILQPRVLDLNTVITGISKMLQRLIGEDVEMVTALDADPATIFADPGQIEQVLMNLAVNARDAMPGGGRLTVATANVEISGGKAGDSASGAYVRLSVRDTGHGMDRKTQARIFEPFFTTKEVGKGTGLGLSTVYGIVQQSGGFLDLESEVGSGATFLVYLPHAREDLSESAPPDREVRSSRGGGETILLVEDDAALRALATRLLERFGYRTLVAPNGQEALRTSRAHEGAIDLLLTDVVMPGMSGRDLADRLTGERTRMRVLFVSGYTDDTILHHGVLQTGIQLLPKPYTPDVLAQKLREVLEA